MELPKSSRGLLSDKTEGSPSPQVEDTKIPFKAQTPFFIFW